MGPELLAATAAGTAIVVGLSAVAGWVARSKVADAVEALLRDDLEDVRHDVAMLKADARRSRDASVGVLAAADRRADHDSGTDPLGLGLLLPSVSERVDLPASGEADEDNDGAIGKGTL